MEREGKERELSEWKLKETEEMEGEGSMKPLICEIQCALLAVAVHCS